MTTQIQRRRGTTTQHGSFTGAAGELTVDTTKDTVVVHDGSTTGGHPLAKENNPTFTGKVGIGTSTPSSYYANDLVVSGSSEGGITIDGPTTGQSYLSFADGTSGNERYRGYIAYDHATDSLKFASAASERLRINGSGLVNVTGGIQVTENVTPAAGSGVEIFKPSSTAGQMQAFDRSGSAWMDLIFKGNHQVFHANGSEAMRIDSSGQVGIGTSTPSRRLTVEGDINVLTGSAIESTSSAGNLQIQGGSTYPGGNILMGGGQGTDDIRFNTTGISTGNTERMRINSSGYVGIGTSSPVQRLHLNSSSVDVRLAMTNSVSGATNSDGTQFQFNHSDFYINNAESGFIQLLTSATPRMTIDSSGNLKLQHTGKFMLTEGSTNAYSISTNGANGNLTIKDEYNNSDRITLDHTGKVGIGTSSPLSGSKLTVASGCLAITGQNTDHSANSIRIGEEGSGRAQFRAYGPDTSTNGLFEFRSCRSDGNNSFDVVIDEQARIRSATSAGGHANADNLTLQDSGSCGITIRSGSSDEGAIYFADGTTGTANYEGFIEYNHTLNCLKFGANGGQTRFTVDNVGLHMAKTSYGSITTDGHHFNHAGWAHHSTTTETALYLNRNGADGNIAAFYKAGGYRGNIYVNSSVTTFNSVSDYRLKENVVNLTDGISRVKQLAPRRFNFKENADLTVDGFIAHEAQAVVPEAVCGEKDGQEMQGMDASKLVPLLTAALQEAITKIETLEAKVAALESA